MKLQVLLCLITIALILPGCKKTPPIETPKENTTNTNTEIQIQAGHAYSLILKTDNTLWGCGAGTSGQLAAAPMTLPGYVSPFVKIADGVKNVYAAYTKTFIIKTDNSLWSTGSHVNGATDNTYKFVKVADGVSKVAIGEYHTLILKTDNTVWAAGYNGDGQLGDGTRTQRTAFIKVADEVKNIFAGGDSYILKTDNTLWKSGYMFEQVNPSLTFIKVLDDVKDVVNKSILLILKTDNTLWSVKARNISTFALSTNAFSDYLTKTADNVKSITQALGSAMVIKNDNTLWAYGDNSFGQLGDGTTVDINTFKKVANDVKGAVLGGSHSIILKTDNSVWACGTNSQHEVNEGPSRYYSSFVKVNLP